jgi:serine/threonine protein kinase
MVVDPSPGAVIAGRYRLDRLLGRGGMGQVWAVTHDVTHRVAALKLLNGPVHLQAARRRRFLREARAASAVNHPNVVRVHDFFELEDGTPVMIMDLLEGETLGRKLAREGSLPLETVAGILLPVVSAVGMAHSRGIIHRDLKPENVFLSSAGEGRVHVLDFGIAKLMPLGTPEGMDDSDALTGTGGLMGTPCYMSPEQGFGEGTVDHRTDIWSLGIVIYEALAGSRPVDGANVGQVLKRLLNQAITPIEVLVPDLPAPVSELVGRMLLRDPEGRPRDLREVAAVLARYTTVAAPAFEAAIGEAPLSLDSSPLSAQSSPRAVVPAAEPSEPIAATDPDESNVTATAPSLGAVASRATLPPRRGYGPLIALSAVLAIAALAVLWSLRTPATSVAGPPVASAAPRAIEPAAPAVEAPPPGEPKAARLTPEPTEAAPAKRSKAGSSRRPPKPASAPTVAPAHPAPASSERTHRGGGLVDEPPF